MPTLATRLLTRAEVERFARKGVDSGALVLRGASPLRDYTAFRTDELPLRSALRADGQDLVQIRSAPFQASGDALDLLARAHEAGAQLAGLELDLRTGPRKRTPFYQLYCAVQDGRYQIGAPLETRYTISLKASGRSSRSKPLPEADRPASMYGRVLEAVGLSGDLTVCLTPEGWPRLEALPGGRLVNEESILVGPRRLFGAWSYRPNFLVRAFGSTEALVEAGRAALDEIGGTVKQAEFRADVLVDAYDPFRRALDGFGVSGPYRVSYMAAAGHYSIWDLAGQEQHAYAFDPFVLVPGGDGLVTVYHHGEGQYHVEAVYDALVMGPDDVEALLERLFDKPGVARHG